MSDQPSEVTTSNSPILRIDSRTGSAVLQLGPSETWTGTVNLSPGDRTALSQPELVAAMTKQPYANAQGN